MLVVGGEANLIEVAVRLIIDVDVNRLGGWPLPRGGGYGSVVAVVAMVGA